MGGEGVEVAKQRTDILNNSNTAIEILETKEGIV